MSETDLAPVSNALARLSGIELEVLIEATYQAPQIAPGLLAWIDSACEWELSRRLGFDYALQPPEAAIGPEEDAISIDAAMAMRAIFAKDPGAVPELFNVLVDLLTGAGRRQ